MSGGADMGFFGGNNDKDQTNELLEQQIQAQNVEVEKQTRQLSERRIKIEKSRSTPDWGKLPSSTGTQ